MRWQAYLLFVFISLGLSALGVLCSFFNPFALLFLNLAAPVVRLFGHDAKIGGWSSLDSTIAVGLLWPLTLAPLHWLNFRVLRWKAWGYVGLLLLAGVIIAFVVLMKNSA